MRTALIWASLAAFLVDQASKYVVIHGMQLWRLLAIDVLPPVLNFRYGENRGINFGLLEGDSNLTRWLLIGFSLLVVIAIWLWVQRSHGASTRMQICAGLLIGGALGNVVDRLLYGYVLDFLNMSCCGINNPFVFNLADVFIFTGAIGLVLLEPAGRAGKAPRAK